MKRRTRTASPGAITIIGEKKGKPTLENEEDKKEESEVVVPKKKARVEKPSKTPNKKGSTKKKEVKSNLGPKQSTLNFSNPAARPKSSTNKPIIFIDESTIELSSDSDPDDAIQPASCKSFACL